MASRPEVKHSCCFDTLLKAVLTFLWADWLRVWFHPSYGELSYWLVDWQTVHPITCQVLFESACVLLNSSSVQQTISSRSEMLHRATVWLIELQYYVALLIWFKINILIQWCFHQPQLGLVFSVSMLTQRWRASWSVLSGVELTADRRGFLLLLVFHRIVDSMKTEYLQHRLFQASWWRDMEHRRLQQNLSGDIK